MSIKLMSMVWEHFPRGGSEKLALLALADWADDDGGKLFPSIAKIAHKINVSRSQAQRIIHGFIDEGILSVVGNEHGGPPGASRHYKINIQSVTGRMGATGSTGATGRMGAQGRVAPMHKTGRMGATLSTNNHQDYPPADISADAGRDNPELFPAESLSSQNSPQPPNPRSAQKKNIAVWAGMELFDQFWRVYPKQRAGNREKAMAAYRKAVKRGFSEADILAGAHAYAASREVAERFAKGAAAWLNDDRFTHDYSEAPNGRKNYPNTASKQDRIEDALAAAKLEIAERWAESPGADALGGTFDGRLYDDEHFRQDSGIIDGDYTVVSG